MNINPSKIEMPDAAMVELLRRMTTAERLAAANRMWVSARKAIYHILSAEHPNWTAEQIQQETARRMSHGAV